MKWFGHDLVKQHYERKLDEFIWSKNSTYLHSCDAWASGELWERRRVRRGTCVAPTQRGWLRRLGGGRGDLKPRPRPLRTGREASARARAYALWLFGGLVKQ